MKSHVYWSVRFKRGSAVETSLSVNVRQENAKIFSYPHVFIQESNGHHMARDFAIRSRIRNIFFNQTCARGHETTTVARKDRVVSSIDSKATTRTRTNLPDHNAALSPMALVLRSTRFRSPHAMMSQSVQLHVLFRPLYKFGVIGCGVPSLHE